MLKQISVAAIVFGMSVSIAVGAGAFPYTFAEYETDYQHTQGSMYTAAHGRAEPGQVWDMCRFPKNRDACADLNSREHIVNVTVNEVASYGTRETNGVATYVQGSFITNAGNAVDVSFSLVGSEPASLAEGQLVSDVDWCHFSYKGYEVIYRPTEKSNWFVPVLGVWI